MKILIAGCGKVGNTLIGQLLDEGHEVTVIDKNTLVLENIIEDYDVIGIQGNSANMQTLKEADVASANLLIAATDLDEVNLLTCLTAHGMNPDLHTIARIRNPEYFGQAYNMRDIFALNMVINPERSAAHEIARLIRYPGFLKIETFAKGNVEIVELKIDKNSPMKNVMLSKLEDATRSNVLVCCVKRGSEAIIPDGSFVLKENDLIFVTAVSNNLSHFLRNTGIVAKKAKRVLISGGGRISYYLASELTGFGISCTIVEKNAARCEELATILPNTTIINGDASSQDFLDRELVGESDALVTLTNLDELNIVTSLFASARGVTQVITKLSHAENNKILDEIDVGSVISPKESASNAIVRYVRAMQNTQGTAVAVHRIAGGRAEAIELIIDKTTKYIGVPLKNIPVKKDILIVSISHVGKTVIPSGNDSYVPGDSVVVVTKTDKVIGSMDDIFEG